MGPIYAKVSDGHAGIAAQSDLSVETELLCSRSCKIRISSVDVGRSGWSWRRLQYIRVSGKVRSDQILRRRKAIIEDCCTEQEARRSGVVNSVSPANDDSISYAIGESEPGTDITVVGWNGIRSQISGDQLRIRIQIIRLTIIKEIVSKAIVQCQPLRGAPRILNIESPLIDVRVALRKVSAGARKGLPELRRPSVQEILIVVEGIAAGKEAREVILRSNEIKVEASLVRVPPAHIRNTRGGLVSVSIRESRAEVVCAKRDATDDLYFRTASIGVSGLLIFNEVEAALENDGRAEHARVSGSD